MNLILIYKREKDSEPVLKVFPTGASLRRFLIMTEMKPHEYCLFEGNVLKTFDHFVTTKGENLCHG